MKTFRESVSKIRNHHWCGHLPIDVAEGPFELEIRRIVTDSDLDGVVTGAILRRWWTDANVIFGHPGELRAGVFDEVICYLNRISDWLFVLGRWIAKNTGEVETLWPPLGTREPDS